MAKVYVPCVIKQLPDHEKESAAANAIAINPANKPNIQAFSSLGMVLNPGRISFLTTKWFGSTGVHLTVGFMGNVPAALQEKIVSHMNSWSQYANVGFTITGGSVQNAQVRISLGSGGYYSYLGTDVLQISKNEQTMNLEGFSLSTPDSEYRRVVRHETGHTLSAPHEHSRREIVARLDPTKTIALFEQTQGWTADEIRQQILTPIEETDLRGQTPHAEVDSIMCYEFPASITIDGVEIPGGTDITPDDGLYMGKLYPLSITPPAPPPPPPVNPPIPPIPPINPPPPPPVNPPTISLKDQLDAIFMVLMAKYRGNRQYYLILAYAKQIIDQYLIAHPAGAQMALGSGSGWMLRLLMSVAFTKAESMYPQYADELKALQAEIEALLL